MNPVLILLKILTETEQRRFSKFLKSPYFVQSKFYAELFNVLRTFCPECNEDEILNSKQYAKLLNKHKWKSIPANNWTGMRKLLKTFIAHEQLKNDEYSTLTLQSDFYAKHTDYNLFIESLQNRKIDLKDSKKTRVGYYQKLNRIEEEIYFHPDTEKAKGHKTNIDKLESTLDDYYYLQKIRISCEKLIRQKLTSEEYAFHDFAQITNHVQVHLSSRYPIAEIYLKCSEFLQADFDLSKYEYLVDLVCKESETIPRNELRRVFILLINITNRARINALLDETHVYFLYKKMIEQDVLAIYDRITPTSFNNIAWLQAELLHFDEAYDFIRSHKKYLSPKFREELEKIAIATVKFKEKKYDDVLKMLAQTFSSHPNFIEIIKPLIMKSDFESDIISGKLKREAKKYDSYLVSFRKYLTPARSAHLSKSKRKEYQNFLTFFKKLRSIYCNRFPELQEIIAFEKQIQITEQLFGRKWFQEKITALKATLEREKKE